MPIPSIPAGVGRESWRNRIPPQQGEQNLTGLCGLHHRQLLRIVPNQICGFKEQQCSDHAGEQRHTHRLNDLAGRRDPVGNQRVNGAQQPEGYAAQGHSEDTLGRGEPGWAVNHHFSVSKGVG